MITNSQRLEKLKNSNDQVAELYGSLGLARTIGSIRSQYNLAVADYDIVDVIGDTILGFYHTKDLPVLLQQQVGVSATIANQIVTELAELLGPVLEREAAEADPKKASLKALQQQFGQRNKPVTTSNEVAPTAPTPQINPAPSTPATAAPTPAATVPTPQSIPTTSKPPIPIPTAPASVEPVPEAERHNVTKMRTMAADMSRVHGYGAFRQTTTDESNVIKSAPQDTLLQSRSPLTNTPKVGE